jgi:hypothetical protein
MVGVVASTENLKNEREERGVGYSAQGPYPAITVCAERNDNTVVQSFGARSVMNNFYGDISAVLRRQSISAGY